MKTDYKNGFRQARDRLMEANARETEKDARISALEAENAKLEKLLKRDREHLLEVGAERDELRDLLADVLKMDVIRMSGDMYNYEKEKSALWARIRATLTEAK